AEMNDSHAGRSFRAGIRWTRRAGIVRALAVFAVAYGCDVSDRDVGLRQSKNDASPGSDAQSAPPIGAGGMKPGSGGGAGLGAGGAHGGSPSGDGGAGGAHPDVTDASAGASGDDGAGGGPPDGGADMGVATVDEPCSESGARACAGHAQVERLECRGGVW